ncbi:MAG: flagellar assembly protein FliH [Spirochaetes bacterium]|nr:flagellar assembly protein FliH [Spirochaetota bacterium]
MSKPVYKPIDIAKISRRVTLESPDMIVQKPEGGEEEVYEGPSVEEIESQIADMRESADKDLEVKKEEAKLKAEEIKKDAENNAFDRIKKASDEGKNKLTEAELKAKEIIADAEIRAKELIMEAERKVSETETQSRDRGYESGRNKGYDEGKEEVSRLINSLNRIISATIERRNEIIKNVEKQLMMIVLLITRKVVKSISEHQKGIVMHNIKDALQKVRGRTNLIIRVNIADLELTTEHKEEFIKMVEDINNVSILEDSTVDKGGCIIETDFGNIDARIASQFEEIEEKIKEIMPITIGDRERDIVY